MMEAALLELFVKTGSLAVVVAFFLWRDYKREAAFNQQVHDLWVYIKDTLEGMTKEVTNVVANNTHMLEVLKDRPCMREKAK